jgi:superfamily II DNA or RNA helicase
MSSVNKTVLTHKGYAILKSALLPQEQQFLRKELTVAPQISEKFSKNIINFPIYLESSTRFYVPRHWGLTHYGKPEANLVTDGLPLSPAVKFKGTPYDYQQAIISKFIEQGANGLICVPCGRGKTFMALCIGIQIGRRFLIVVDKEFLANQWRGEIENYIEGARVGIVQQNRIEVEAEKYDITICMLQTICSREFPTGLFNGYGYAIFDECHHLGAQHFSRVLTKIQTKHMLGLSATPDRDDGLTKVFEWFLGSPVYQERSRDPDPTVEVEALWYTDSDPAYADAPTDRRGEVVTARLLTQVVECKRRTARILGRLRKIATDNRRKILVLSERRAHLEEICDGLVASGEFQNLDAVAETDAVAGLPSIGFYVGGMDQEDLDRNAQSCQILLATYAMASEAMNIKSLNSMLMASPRKKVEQSTGRILRITPDKRVVQPLIVDVIDQHETYIRQWWARARYYKKCAYNIRHVDKPRLRAEEDAKLNEQMQNECIIRLPTSA